MNGGQWLCKTAVLWALDEAEKVPASLVSTLIAIARFADNDGRGAHPSTETIARCTRKGKRQARRDLDELEALGLLVPGNPQIVAHIRADRRPLVYDLAMPRGVTDDPSSSHGGSPMTARGVMQGTHGGSPVTPEHIQRNRTRTPVGAPGRDDRTRRWAKGRSCDRNGPGKHSTACRAGESQGCAASWCQCTCHGRRP